MDDIVPRKPKKQSVLSKLATKQDHSNSASPREMNSDQESWSRNELAHELGRQRLNQADDGVGSDSDSDLQPIKTDKPKGKSSLDVDNSKGSKRSRAHGDINSYDSDVDSGSDRNRTVKRPSPEKGYSDGAYDEVDYKQSFQKSLSNTNVSNGDMDSDIDSSSNKNTKNGSSSARLVNSYKHSLMLADQLDDDEMRDEVPSLRRQPKNGNPVVASSALFNRSATGTWSIGSNGPMSETGCSEQSNMSNSVLTTISTKEARKRSYLVGSINSGCSMLGAEEMERYFPERKMRVFVGTWNMCEMKSVPTSLDDFLLPETSEVVMDVYVIGSQESVANRQEWELKIQETLGPQYVLFHACSHGTLHIVVFLRRDLIWFCSVSEEASVTTRPGPSGIKTKGAVAICFHMFGTSLLFINSHFTAHDGRANERVEDYKKIIRDLALPKIVTGKTYTDNVDVSSRFDCVFWMGDLNCRLERERSQLEALISGVENTEIVNYEEVLQHDELKRVLDKGLAFHNFQEGRIKFRPTYKYDIGSDNFDTSKKNRVPSYTDRILYRCRKKNSIACLCYDSAFSVRDSDHKPVYGLYEVSVRPGVDTIPLSGGQFNRAVWLEGIRRRASKLESMPVRGKSDSSVCDIM